MSSTGTLTTTYTVADIRKVVENFEADYTMIAQSTGLRTRESVVKDSFDLKIFAEYGYLMEVKLFLLDKDGNRRQAAVYKVSNSAVGWISDRPGNSLWPRTMDGSLWLVATLTDSWWQKTDAAKLAFIKERGFYGSWTKTDKDTSLSGFMSSAGQKYASNGYGWERTNYSK